MKALSRFLTLTILQILLLTGKLCAQLSPLFQNPSMGFDLPVFNPAFAGDSDNYRIFGSLAALKTNIGGDLWNFNNTSTLLSADKKFTVKNSNALAFTSGLSFQHNRVAIDSDAVDAILSGSPGGANIDQAIYSYGTFEGTFGIRMLTSLMNKAVTRTKTPKARKLYKKNKRNKPMIRHDTKPEDETDYERLNKYSICEFTSIQDFVAMNVVLGMNFTSFSNAESGLVFNDQISQNLINDFNSSVSNPFSINGSSNDGVLLDPNLNGSTRPIYFGFGILYHNMLRGRNNKLLRIGYSMRNIFQPSQSVPESQQRLARLKTAQVQLHGIKFWVSDKVRPNLNLRLLYIDQSTGWFPEFNDGINQWRLSLTNRWDFRSSSKDDAARKQAAGWDAGVEVYYYDRSVSTLSALVAVKMRFNSDFDFYRNAEISRAKQLRKNKNGRIIRLFLNYDVHLANNLVAPTTSGNLRFGITLEGWDL